jgi:hypothetical protein
MALTIPQGRPHTAAVVTTLETAGLTVGDGTGAGLTTPYVVVYTDSGDVDGPLGDRYADLTQTVFIHAVGTGPEQAQWAADKARAALLTTAVTVAGRTVLYLDHVTSVPVRRDDSIRPPLFLAIDQFALATTPA